MRYESKEVLLGFVMKSLIKLAVAIITIMSVMPIQAQNIGIGETAPANKLSVKGSLSVGTSYSTTIAPTSGAIIQGNVGIGTASPTVTLDVNGSIRVRGLTSAGVVQSDANGNLSVSNFGIVPIGAIIAWHGSYTNTPSLPSGWVECNGQTLSDAASPYNGQIIPDLNAAIGGDYSRFLRGSTASGTLQAEDVQPHNHTATISTNGTPTGQNPSTCTTGGMQTGGSYGPCFGYVSISATVNNSTGSETRPYNMSVIWIMRVK